MLLGAKHGVHAGMASVFHAELNQPCTSLHVTSLTTRLQLLHFGFVVPAG